MTALPRPLRLPVTTVRTRERLVACALVAVVLIAGALRLAEATGTHGPLSADERAYVALASDVATSAPYGSGMERPLHWAPGAPAAFGAALALDPGGSLRAAYALQALLGTALVLAVFALGAVVAGRRAGLVAAAAVAVYPPLVQLSGSLLSEGLGTLLLVLATLATVVAATRRDRWWAWTGAGVLWGSAVLTRADVLLAPLLVAVVVLLAARLRGGGARGAVILLAATAATLAPWSAYASTRAGGPVPVTTGGAAALFVGTYLPGGGTTIGAKRVLGDELAAVAPGTLGRPASDVPAGLMLDVVARRHPALGRDAAVAREARVNLARYPLGDPVAYAGMTLDKLRRMWLAPSRVGGPPAGGLVAALHPAAVLAASMLALLALWRTRSLGLALLLVPVVTSLLMHAVMVANPRYALAVLPLLVVAGVAGARQAVATAGAGASVASRTQRDVHGIRRPSIRSR